MTEGAGSFLVVCDDFDSATGAVQCVLLMHADMIQLRGSHYRGEIILAAERRTVCEGLPGFNSKSSRATHRVRGKCLLLVRLAERFISYRPWISFSVHIFLPRRPFRGQRCLSLFMIGFLNSTRLCFCKSKRSSSCGLWMTPSREQSGRARCDLGQRRFFYPITIHTRPLPLTSIRRMCSPPPLPTSRSRLMSGLDQYKYFKQINRNDSRTVFPIA